MKGQAAIILAAILSFAFQPTLASTMASPQCSTDSAMADHEASTIAENSDLAGQSGCRSENESSGGQECGAFCLISCTSNVTANVSPGALFSAAPSRAHYETDSRRPLLQFSATFIPPPPRT
jgi:hypothetical protein